MRNTFGTILAASGAGLAVLPFSVTAAAVVAGVLLFVGAILLVIDLDGS